MELYSDTSPLAAFDFYDAIGFPHSYPGYDDDYFANGIFATPCSSSTPCLQIPGKLDG